MPSKQWDGYYERGMVDQPVPGKPRAYSYVLMQTANDLANLPPFQARAKIIGWDEKKKSPRLVEHCLDNLDPRIVEYHEFYYGIPNPANTERIREKSRKMSRTREEVDAEITKGTAGLLTKIYR